MSKLKNTNVTVTSEVKNVQFQHFKVLNNLSLMGHNSQRQRMVRQYLRGVQFKLTSKMISHLTASSRLKLISKRLGLIFRSCSFHANYAHSECQTHALAEKTSYSIEGSHLNSVEICVHRIALHSLFDCCCHY